ncbi:hypothetical protein PR001_g16272 [Phytophthora rubi]|uniref:Peptidase S74 domain-containing protein n=1 Tax=Phytophthora rubi TaxID=129364 RepID=A0A6A3L366_9STRA|nr:hypothetical protein PR002_g16454 [Phytophthora rubi]KAE9010093.1 hypothetical protein PR001_g16272 [Phytophthora rubi]
MSITGTLQTATQSNITSLGTLSGLSIDGSLVFSGANRSITGLNSLSATSLTGTLQTAAQTNITSLGTLSGLTIGGNLTFTGASRSITGLASLSATSITGTLQTASQTNITSLGALTGLTIDGSLSFTGSFRSISGVSSISVVSSISSSIGNFGSIQINNSTIITSTPSITNVVDITCAGYLNAFAGIKLNSVAFVDASRNISAATLATTGDITIEGSINGFLAYGNQSAITNVGSLNELGIHSTPTNEYFTITGSGLDYLDGSYTRMMTLKGSNATPVQFQIEVNNGTNATSSNATWIGNYTNNDIRFGINNTTAMILTTTNRLGVGTSSPSAPLHIVGSNNFVFGAGGTTVYRLRTDNGITESALGPITYSVAAIFGGYISCSAMAMTSDRRLKRNIIDCPIDRIKILYDNVSVKLYDWIESENRPGQEVGLIAQDLVSARLTDLISIFYRDDIEEGSDLNLEPAKQQLNVDYSRISAYNMRMIQHLMQEIAEIKSRLANI